MPRLDVERPLHIAVPAAKLHVLHLEPIKARVGEKWPRLSQLVHDLFEKALRRAQGPFDRFIQVDELSYIATFEGRTLEQAAIACMAVAQEVCDLLFGEESHAVSLRSVVGMVPEADIEPELHTGIISAVLEQSGSERIITKRTRHERATGQEAQMGGVAGAHRALEAHHLRARLFPVWDIAKQNSSCLLFKPVGESGKARGGVRRLLPLASEDQVADLEIALLSAAGDYAQRAGAAHKLCALGTGVGWETLSIHATRVRYLAALKSLPNMSQCPLLLKIEDIPAGMPQARIAELASMLTPHHVRVLVEFAPGARIRDFTARLNIAGIGAMLPDPCDAEEARTVIDMVVRRAERQKAFSFVSGITAATARLAAERGLKFGCGPGLDGAHILTGLETVPDFPLLPCNSVAYV
jgi:hypothetical protein